MAVFDDLFGNPSGSTNLAEGDLRRVARRAQRFVGRGAQPPGVAGIRARAADQAGLPGASFERNRHRMEVPTKARGSPDAELW